MNGNFSQVPQEPVPHANADPDWKEKNLLSLDGGGIRGYWTLLVLERLMDEIREVETKQTPDPTLLNTRLDSFWPSTRPSNVLPTRRNTNDEEITNDNEPVFLPCHYFDIICGSSTGSLIAIMLCRFRMSVEDAKREYEQMGNEIFGSPRWFSHRNVGIPRPKYRSLAVERAFRDVTQRRGEEPGDGRFTYIAPLYPTIRGTCVMFATAYHRDQKKRRESTLSLKKLYLIRSYDHRTKEGAPELVHGVIQGPAERMEIWQVARSATAAPMYFKEMKFDTQQSSRTHFFSDGGFGVTNNPTLIGHQEMETNWGPDNIGAIVSIGTSRAVSRDGSRIMEPVRDAFEHATDPQHVADVMRGKGLEHYWRLNDDVGIEMELDDWKPNSMMTRKQDRGRKTLRRITENFNQWAGKPQNYKLIEQCAAELVRRRRARIKNSARWERFATGAHDFQCRHEDCQDFSLPTRAFFEEHWQKCHQNKADAQRCKEPDFKVWEYKKRF